MLTSAVVRWEVRMDETLEEYIDRLASELRDAQILEDLLEEINDGFDMAKP
jgi:hypothetical protein